MRDHHKRSMVKAVSWRVMGTMTTSVLVLMFTGEWVLSIEIGLLEFVGKVFIFYLYERIWNFIEWGRMTEKEFETVMLKKIQEALGREYQAILVFSYQDSAPKPAEAFPLVGMSLQRIQELIVEGKVKDLWLSVQSDHGNHMQSVLNSLMGIDKKRNWGWTRVVGKIAERGIYPFSNGVYGPNILGLFYFRIISCKFSNEVYYEIAPSVCWFFYKRGGTCWHH